MIRGWAGEVGPARYGGRVPRITLPIIFSANGAPAGGETLVTEAGASVLVLTSTSAALGIELRSAYLEGEQSASVLSLTVV